MSSFKIERHRVRFIPPDKPLAETQDQKAQPSRPSEAEVRRLYEEIFQRLTREHAEQAELILEEAAEKARVTLKEAEEKAQALLADAKAQAECITREAETKMREEEERRLAAYEKQCQEETRRREEEFRTLETALQSRYLALVDEIEEGTVSLVEIVRKVIGLKLTESDAVFLGLVREAIERLRQQGTATIRVSRDTPATFGHQPGWQSQFETGEMKAHSRGDSDFHPATLWWTRNLSALI